MIANQSNCAILGGSRVAYTNVKYMFNLKEKHLVPIDLMLTQFAFTGVLFDFCDVGSKVRDCFGVVFGVIPTPAH